MASTYRLAATPPWDIPITCFAGLQDPYVTRDEAVQWHRYTKSEFRIHFREGNHFLVVEDRTFIASTIAAELESQPTGKDSTPHDRTAVT
jgi:surfactin synthase thioesterase subunit